MLYCFKSIFKKPYIQTLFNVDSKNSSIEAGGRNKETKM